MESKEREMCYLLEEIWIYGTPESELIEDGFTQEEIDWAKNWDSAIEPTTDE